MKSEPLSVRSGSTLRNSQRVSASCVLWRLIVLSAIFCQVRLNHQARKRVNSEVAD